MKMIWISYIMIMMATIVAIIFSISNDTRIISVIGLCLANMLVCLAENVGEMKEKSTK